MKRYIYILSYSILSSLSGHIIHPSIHPSLGNTFVMMMTPSNIVVGFFFFFFLFVWFPSRAMESSSKVGEETFTI